MQIFSHHYVIYLRIRNYFTKNLIFPSKTFTTITFRQRKNIYLRKTNQKKQDFAQLSPTKSLSLYESSTNRHIKTNCFPSFHQTKYTGHFKIVKPTSITNSHSRINYLFIFAIGAKLLELNLFSV